MIRILIADDHPIFRSGLRDLLAREFGEVSCGEAGNGEETLVQAQSQEWDLVIMGISMPGQSGIHVLRELKKTRTNVPVLILSRHPEDQFGKRLIKLGASGYVNKQSSPEELVEAVRRVLAGGLYVSPALAEKLALEAAGKGEGYLHERLSDREFEVFRMVAFGKTISQIADELHLAVPTVGTYRARILEKMEMNTTGELIRYAMRHRLVE
ncbi:MAG: response regulator [Terriglobia bacterium]